VTPDYTITEIKEHEDELIEKTKLTKEELWIALTLIFEHVTVIPLPEYEGLIEECKNYISSPDDIPHLAVCIASNAQGIWSHDRHFLEQRKARVFTNIDLFAISRNAKRD
jgi:predicted nucleic acid-binding protein